MHVTTKEVDSAGVHTLTSVIEGDGAVELASDKADLAATVISISRTASGGVQVQVAVSIKEPAPAIPPTQEQVALAYFTGKGFTDANAAAQVARFGVDRVLAQKANEEATKQQSLDKELAAVLAGEKPAAPTVN